MQEHMEYPYETPVILAVLDSADLAGSVPPDLTPHVHASQNS
ncbi:hypothetical protein GCM10027294_12190 [Marinactinospora endophytica]